MGSTAAKKRARIGFDYVHSVVDDHSRFAYSEILGDEAGDTTTAFFARALDEFAAHGITVSEVMTDNAWNYTHTASMAALLAQAQIKHRLIRPHCPWQNGKVERFNRTLQTEWAYRQVFTTNTDRSTALAPWLEHYNTRRRHSALGGRPPISRMSPT
jgi:transposase InsO family protein